MKKFKSVFLVFNSALWWLMINSFTEVDSTANLKHSIIFRDSVVQGVINLHENIEIDLSIRLVFSENARVECNGYTLNMKGGIVACNNRQIFFGKGYVYGLDTVRPEWWGGKGDFDLKKGVGTHNRIAIRRAVESVMLTGGGVILFNKNGRYYVGDDFDDNVIGAQILIKGQSKNKIVINGNGCSLYAGRNGGKMLVLSGVENMVIKNMHITGSAGGPYNSSRENDALIAITDKSKGIHLSKLRLSNSLGDCIYIGGSLQQAEGGIGYTSQDILIDSCILKQRAGNLKPSMNGGTQGRNCLSVIDGANIIIKNNRIYGRIDLEPNISGQHLEKIRIENNEFLKGPVSNQTKIGQNKWYEEPLMSVGGAIIPAVVMLNGKPGAPIISGNTIINNRFEHGTILGFRVYMWKEIAGNQFARGLIQIGEDNNIGSASGAVVENNSAEKPMKGKKAFIIITGQIAGNIFRNNTLHEAGEYFCIMIEKEKKGAPFNQGNFFINNNATHSKLLEAKRGKIGEVSRKQTP